MHELPPTPNPEELTRLRSVVVAGHRGDRVVVDAHLDDPSPLVREAALGASVRVGDLDPARLHAAFADPDPRVRRRAAELAAIVTGADPRTLLDDLDPSVVEIACFACGEIAWPDEPPVARLSEIATGHPDPLCRESAAAALGAIGHPAGLNAVLAACADRVTVRRRATLALAAFDDPRAEAALRSALDDKDWQVRQAAEDLVDSGRLE